MRRKGGPLLRQLVSSLTDCTSYKKLRQLAHRLLLCTSMQTESFHDAPAGPSKSFNMRGLANALLLSASPCASCDEHTCDREPKTTRDEEIASEESRSLVRYHGRKDLLYGFSQFRSGPYHSHQKWRDFLAEISMRRNLEPMAKSRFSCSAVLV